MKHSGGGEQTLLHRVLQPSQHVSEWPSMEPLLATDEDLYGPSYYPTVDPTAMRFSASAASSPLGGVKSIGGVASSSHSQPSMLRTHVPYLKDLRMSREMLVYQSVFSTPQQNPSAIPAAANASLASRMMSLGTKTISSLSKSISQAVPSVHNAIAEWDDGSSQRRASGLMGAPITVGGKPLPSITVSCEEGKFARHFYELKEHREGYDTISNAKSEEELDALMETTLVIPSWPERAATPEELAIEKHFADEAGYWQDVYWERIAEARKHHEHQEFMYQAALPSSAGAAGGGNNANPRKNSVVFTRSGATLRSPAQTVVIAPQPPPNIVHPVSRKPSMPMMKRQVSPSASLVAALQPSTSTAPPPRWSVSQKVDNTFRREVGSISSISSSVLEHGSQTSSNRTGSLRDLRKAALAQPKVTTATNARRDSVGPSTGSFPRIVRKTPGAASLDSPSKVPGNAVPFYRESPSERKMQGIGRRSVSPTEGANELTCSAATVVTDPDTLEERTDDGLSNNAGPLPSPHLIALHGVLSSTASTIEPADLPPQRSGTTTPDRDDPLHESGHTNDNDSIMNSSYTGSLTTKALHHRSHRGRHLRPPIPWPAEWSLPMSFLCRQIAIVPSHDNAVVEDNSTLLRIWESSSDNNSDAEEAVEDDAEATAASDASPVAIDAVPHDGEGTTITPIRMGSLASTMRSNGGTASPVGVATTDANAPSPVFYVEDPSSPPRAPLGDFVGRMRATSDPTTEAAPSPVAADGKREGSTDNLLDRTQSSAVLPATVVSPANRSTHAEGTSSAVQQHSTAHATNDIHAIRGTKPPTSSKPQPPLLKPPSASKVATANNKGTSSRSCCAVM